MTNHYAIEIHDYVSEKIKWAKEMKEQAGGQQDMPLIQFYKGQLKEWMKMREYMDRTIDLKTQQYY
jgi:hypothetical protein